MQVGIWGPLKNIELSSISSLLTQAVLFVSRHSISTTYDHRRHPQGPNTIMITPNTIISFRKCCKRVFGVPQTLLKHLKESQHQHRLFGLGPDRVIHTHLTRGATHRNLRQAKLHPTQLLLLLLLLDSAVSAYLGSYQK